MRVFDAPNLPTIGPRDTSIFLGGSIEMGKAVEWQSELIGELGQFLDNSWVALNPRRKEWDSSWVQSITNPQFFQQVDWEMTYLERADHRVFYFAPNTMSPITLLEMGKYGMYSTYVVCDKDYQRRGNVEIFCHRHEIPFYNTLGEVVNEFRRLSSLP
jgi:hypothetical protein